MSATRNSAGPFTSSHSFAAVDCYGGPDLLEVRAGVPAATALLEASAILESCETLAVAITSEAGRATHWHLQGPITRDQAAQFFDLDASSAEKCTSADVRH